MLANHIEKIQKLFKENWQQLNLFIFMGPAIYILCVSLFLLCDRMAGIGPHRVKFIMEIVPFVLLVPMMMLAFLRCCTERSWFFLWYTGFMGTIICREVHWDWTTGGVFVLLGLLMVLAYLFYDKLRPQISTPQFVNMFVTIITLYFIASMLLDQNWARIPKDFRTDINFKKALEECVEVMGHFLLAVTVLLIPRKETSPSSIPTEKS